MTLAIRVLANSSQPTIRVGDRTFATGGATTVDIPLISGNANVDPSEGQVLCVVGTTTDRPSNVPGNPNFSAAMPAQYYDTTIAAFIAPVLNSFPVKWVNVLTGAGA